MLATALVSHPPTNRGMARYKTEGNLQVVDRCVPGCTSGMCLLTTASLHNSVEELAKKKGVKMAQVALAWMFAKPGVSAPIIGTTSTSNLEELIGKRARVFVRHITTGLTRCSRRLGRQAVRGRGQVFGGAVQADGRHWGFLNVCDSAGIFSCETLRKTVCCVVSLNALYCTVEFEKPLQEVRTMWEVVYILRASWWPQGACVLYPPMCLHSGTMRMPHPTLEASRLMERFGIK